MQPAPTIKKIHADQLRVGMYVHDLNCDWTDHSFLRNRFRINDAGTLAKIRALGPQEIYIDTGKGGDAVQDSPSAAEVQDKITQELVRIASSLPPRIKSIPPAKQLHEEATQIVRSLMTDIRMGHQIEMEPVDHLVEAMTESIFQAPHALLPLGLLKSHDTYSFQHSVSVCALMIAFSRGLNLPRHVIHEIATGALLHDVGKAKVPDEILNKPAKLTELEFGKMRSHVTQSIMLLQQTPGISPIALDVAGQHHERYDGTGYPNKLKGDQISLYGQMGAIVDVYDAITSNRVYHKGMPPTQALSKLLEWSTYHFNPELVRNFIRTVGIYPTGSLVRLSSGRLGIVREQHPEALLQPIVEVMYSTSARTHLPPERVDLAQRGMSEKIEGPEDFATWGIDARYWIGS